MANIRVMSVFQGASGLPEDKVVNVWHFTGAGTAEDMYAPAFDAVTDFFNEPNTTSTISAYLSPWLGYTGELRGYDLAEAKPRVPTIAPLERAFSSASSGLPEEVAVCVTLHGVVPPALTARRRGRVYIGPLATGAMTAGTNSAPSRPSGVFVNDLRDAAARLVAASSTGVVWSILSSVPSTNFVRVAAGYIDNAFDTQRRRGPDPTDRTLFGFPGV